MDNVEAVVADNVDRYFAGSGADGAIERSLVVGNSLNYNMNGVTRPVYAVSYYSGFATYHSEFSMRNNIIMEFDAIDNQTSGSFATNDYYLRPVEKGQIRNYNNIIINAHPGVKMESGYDHFVFAGALWDTSGTWSGTPGNNYLVYDQPFFTDGLTTQTINPSTAVTGGVLVPSPFYGFNHFIINQSNIEWQDLMEIDVDRLNTIDFSIIDNWNIQAANIDWLLSHMRHFATHPSGYYELQFPTSGVITDVAVTIENMLYTSDFQVIAIEYSGNHPISQVFTTPHNNILNGELTEYPTYDTYKHVYTAVNSRDEVINSTTGEVYWQDTQNDLVWMKIRGGLTQLWNDVDYHEWSDERLYRRFWLRIHNQAVTALPVELMSFSASVTPNQQVQLQWITASEINNHRFEIERSVDGEAWSKIGTIEGHGTTSNHQQYQFIDESPLKGRSYYRLKQVDLDGTFTYSSIESVSLVSTEELIAVFPNPVVDKVQIQLKQNYQDIAIQLMNTKGQVLKAVQLKNQSYFELEMKDLSSGVYFIKLDLDGEERVVRVVK